MCCRIVAAEDVGFHGDDFEVRGIHTSLVAAKVIDSHTGWNWATEQFIRKPVCADTFLWLAFAWQLKGTVTIA